MTIEPATIEPVTKSIPPSHLQNRLDRIRQRIRETLEPEHLELIDDSHLHAGHAGARDGKGHFRVRIVSPRFAGLRTIRRHQLVYGSLQDLMQTDIHALSIVALTAEEFRSELPAAQST